MSSKRECIESPAEQSPDEAISYSITTTPWGSTPTDVALVVWDVTDDNAPSNVTDSTTAGSNSVASDVITTKRITTLTVGHKYRVDVLFTDSGSNVHECFFIVYCRN